MKNQRFILIAKRCINRLDRSVSLLLVGICLIGSLTPLQAQQVPIHTQYFLNPFVYNPAFVGNEGYTEVFFTHRRQWVEMEGAPVTTALSIHLPTRTKLAFGANLYTTRQGLLNTTSGMATVGYTLQLSSNQYLRAGISAGFRSTGIDQSQINASNASDPAFTSDYNNYVGLDANVGLNYQIAGLTIGGAIANPFKRANTLNDGTSKATVSPLDQYILSAGYRIEMEGATIEPQLLYGRQAGDQARMEALATVYLRDVVWVGGSYRNGYGPSFFAGVRLAEVARIGYAYELASQQVDGIGRGSHELLLSYRFGEKKETGPANGRRRKKGDEVQERYLKQQKKAYDKATKKKVEEAKKAAKQKEAAKKADQTAVSDSLQTGKQPIKSITPPGAKKKPAANPSTRPEGNAPGAKTGKEKKGKPGTTSFTEFLDQPKDSGKPMVTPKPEDLKATDENFDKVLRTVAADPNNPDSMPKGYYVIVGTFQHEENAERFSKELSTKGFPKATYKLNPESKYFHVYTLSTQTVEEARKEWAKLREQPGFQDTWVNVLQVE
jgi:type IX secretion system PorP/SprF family membrane protein